MADRSSAGQAVKITGMMSVREFNENRKLLKAMHEVIMYMNDEECVIPWLYVVPDCPTEEDFEDIASDREAMDMACACFRRIVEQSGKHGWFTNYSVIGPLTAYGADKEES